MAYYIMKQYTLIDGSASIDGVPESIDPLGWMQGKPMQAPEVELIFDLSPESGDYRGSIMGSFVTLYHETLKEGLENFGIENVQFYPVVLRDQNTQEKEDGYLLVNIIGLYDCIDMEKSEIKWWPSKRGFDFESMVIDETKTNGAKIFRLKEDPTKVIIDETLKQYFDKTDLLVGVELIQTEDYSDW